MCARDQGHSVWWDPIQGWDTLEVIAVTKSCAQSQGCFQGDTFSNAHKGASGLATALIPDGFCSGTWWGI